MRANLLKYGLTLRQQQQQQEQKQTSTIARKIAWMFCYISTQLREDYSQCASTTLLLVTGTAHDAQDLFSLRYIHNASTPPPGLPPQRTTHGSWLTDWCSAPTPLPTFPLLTLSCLSELTGQLAIVVSQPHTLRLFPSVGGFCIYVSTTFTGNRDFKPYKLFPIREIIEQDAHTDDPCNRKFKHNGQSSEIVYTLKGVLLHLWT